MGLSTCEQGYLFNPMEMEKGQEDPSVSWPFNFTQKCLNHLALDSQHIESTYDP